MAVRVQFHRRLQFRFERDEMKPFSILLLCLTVFGAINLSAQSGSLAAPDWENPRVFGINKEPARASFTPFPDESSAMSEDRGLELVESLDGTWKFHWVKSSDLRPVDFYKSDFDVSSWKEILVPSNWEM